ncbi:hypothetical protein [Actinokineospora cianjurensis]|nr:hypothetical protein [Actinokineospora cianjurensis]
MARDKAAGVIKAARVDGIAEATVKRARKRAGIATVRQGFGQGSVWSIDV